MLKEQFESYENLSIAKVAEATKVSYAMLVAKSRQPVEGQVYDANVRNYDAMEAFLAKKEIDLTTIDWKAIAETATATKAAKAKIQDFEVGDQYMVKYFKKVATVVYVTKEYVCILLDGSEQPKVLAYSTFNSCGITKVEAAVTEAAVVASIEVEQTKKSKK